MNRIVVNGTEIIVSNGEKFSPVRPWDGFWMGFACGVIVLFLLSWLLPSGGYEKRNRQIEEIHKRLCGDHPEGSQDHSTQP